MDILIFAGSGEKGNFLHSSKSDKPARLTRKWKNKRDFYRQLLNMIYVQFDMYDWLNLYSLNLYIVTWTKEKDGQ